MDIDGTADLKMAFFLVVSRSAVVYSRLFHISATDTKYSKKASPHVQALFISLLVSYLLPSHNPT